MDFTEFASFGIRPREGLSFENVVPSDLQDVVVDENGARTVYMFEDTPAARYLVQKKVGEGSYGTVFKVTQAGNTYAIKKIVIGDADFEKRQKHFVQAFQEAIMNILLFRESAERPGGPYVQHFFELGCNESDGVITLFLRIEYLSRTFGQLIASHTPARNDALVPAILKNLSTILRFFHTQFQMNHRDLKSDNIMLARTADKKWSVRLIDFGLTCLTYKGVYISSRGIFSNVPAACDKPSRDMSLLLLELLLDFRPYFSAALQAELEAMAVVRVATPPLEFRLNKFAAAADFREWEDAYTFLNRENVANPHATLKAVGARMGAFLKRGGAATRRRRVATRQQTRRRRRRH